MSQTVIGPEDDEKTAKIRKISSAVWIVAPLVILIGDIFGVPNPGRGDTPSEVYRDTKVSWWILPIVWGYVGAHLNLTIGQPDTFKMRFLISSAVMLVLLILNLMTVFVWKWKAGGPELIGAYFLGHAIGVALWSQDMFPPYR
jgi:hypothetical protein